ncbi:hypothetical protein CEXT_202841 [Caerostris extrusa]|uniref:Uncharacterized protein n=1 Tax=Caerostris extrusa TaxID=172846 RepID=A0AAV4UQC6_CAEEX|nr:hypothetical protein CEXT_202841 [Caerostris extrusa]
MFRKCCSERNCYFVHETKKIHSHKPKCQLLVQFHRSTTVDATVCALLHLVLSLPSTCCIPPSHESDFLLYCQMTGRKGKKKTLSAFAVHESLFSSPVLIYA